MNESASDQLQLKLIEVITEIQSAVKAGGDFAMDQLPEVARSFVVYGMVRTVVYSLIWLIISVILLMFSKWCYKNPWGSEYTTKGIRTEGNIVCIVVSTILGVVTGTLAIATFDIMVWVAPKVWLMKELASMLK